MSDYSKLKDDIAAIFADWQYLVVDQGYLLDVDYYADHLYSNGIIANEDVTMCTYQQWAYKKSTISVNLRSCDRMNKQGLERIVVHELVHILLGDCQYEHYKMEERVCTEITSAIIGSRRHK